MSHSCFVPPFLPALLLFLASDIAEGEEVTETSTRSDPHNEGSSGYFPKECDLYTSANIRKRMLRSMSTLSGALDIGVYPILMLALGLRSFLATLAPWHSSPGSPGYMWIGDFRLLFCRI